MDKLELALEVVKLKDFLGYEYLCEAQKIILKRLQEAN
jgi:hypothetical protein